jgi:signal transduction histidine kinase
VVNKILKNKFSIFGIIFIFIIAFNYLSFNYFIKSFISLEKQENSKTLSALVTYIDTRFDNIRNISNDYSYWDDTYEFIQDENEEYIYDNFRNATLTLENINLNFMIFVNIKNESIYSQITQDIDIKNKNDFTKHIINSIKDEENISIMKYENYYYYLVKSKILKSDFTGETKGYIYSGKRFHLDKFSKDYKSEIKFIDKIPTIIDINLKSKFINKIDVHFDYKENILSNILILNNEDTHPAIIEFDMDRDIYKEGKKQIILFNFVVSIFILILFFIFYLYLNHHQKLNKQLEEKIQNEIKKQKAQEEILIHQSRSAEIGEMINNIAHQWRQPLNNLSLTIQNIGFTYENGVLTQENLDESINKSKKIIKSMSNTIDTFRNFFEPNKDKNLFKIKHSVDNTFEILSSILRFYNIELIEDIIDDAEIYDYENEFSQVLLNLITNAKDALVLNKIEKPIIRITISKVSDKLIIEIKDNAKGIDENIINRIFEPYFTTKGKGEGTGIGLYMSKLIIEKNMHGKLEAKNDTEGAVFIITLNIAKEEI